MLATARAVIAAVRVHHARHRSIRPATTSRVLDGKVPELQPSSAQPPGRPRHGLGRRSSLAAGWDPRCRIRRRYRLAHVPLGSPASARRVRRLSTHVALSSFVAPLRWHSRGAFWTAVAAIHRVHCDERVWQRCAFCSGPGRRPSGGAVANRESVHLAAVAGLIRLQWRHASADTVNEISRLVSMATQRFRLKLPRSWRRFSRNLPEIPQRAARSAESLG